MGKKSKFCKICIKSHILIWNTKITNGEVLNDSVMLKTEPGHFLQGPVFLRAGFSQGQFLSWPFSSWANFLLGHFGYFPFFEPELYFFMRQFDNLLMFCADSSAAEEVEENV